MDYLVLAHGGKGNLHVKWKRRSTPASPILPVFIVETLTLFPK
jgi:hypothetical protein